MNHPEDEDQQGQQQQHAQEEEEEEITRADREQYMPEYLSGPLDQTRMQLSPQEQQWALNVKAAIEADDDLDSLCDFWYAQIALVARGNIAQALERAHKLHSFRQENQILDTWEHGKEALKYFIDSLPGHLLHFFYSPPTNKYILICDMSKTRLDALNSYEKRKRIFAGSFYLHHTFHPDLEAVREGFFCVCECKHFRWKAPNMLDLNTFRMILQEAEDFYPFQYHKIRFMNTSVMFRVMTSMVKRCIPREVHDKFEVGESDTTLDRVCLVPSVEVVTERILREMTEALRRRYEQERLFRL